MQEITIKTPMISLSTQKVIKDYGIIVKLGKRLEYKCSGKLLNLTDDGIEDGPAYMCDVHVVLFPENITLISKEYTYPDKKWLIFIETSGTNFIIKVYFDKEEDANNLFDKAVEYREFYANNKSI